MSDQSAALPTWDLSDLYGGVNDPALEADLKRIEADATAFESRFKGTIASAELTASHLRDALEPYSALVTDHYKPGSYASLLYSTDTTDPTRGALLQKTREFDSTIAEHIVFFDLEIGLIPDTVYDVAVADESLAPFRHYLDHQRQLAAHNLPEAEEKVLVETAISRGRALARLATEVNTRTRFTVQLEGQAEEEKTQSEILPLLYDPVRETRRRAAAALSHGLEANRHVGTFIYNTLLHEKDVLDRLRSYNAPEHSRHVNNELSSDIVDTMSDVCAANYDIVADYYRLKARLLQLPELTHYDRYAPITSMETPFSFERGREIVLAAFGEFSPRLAEMAEPFFSRRWIDAALADGKRGGAYCAGITPDHHPYVFLNYTERPRDVMTLAHELGHGVHMCSPRSITCSITIRSCPWRRRPAPSRKCWCSNGCTRSYRHRRSSWRCCAARPRTPLPPCFARSPCTGLSRAPTASGGGMASCPASVLTSFGRVICRRCSAIPSSSETSTDAGGSTSPTSSMCRFTYTPTLLANCW